MASSGHSDELWYEVLEHVAATPRKHGPSTRTAPKQLTLYVVDCSRCMEAKQLLEAKKFVVQQLLSSALSHRPGETCAVAAWTNDPYIVYKPGTPTETSVRLACNRLRARAREFYRPAIDRWLSQLQAIDGFDQTTVVLISAASEKLHAPRQLREWRTQRRTNHVQCQCLYTAELRLGSETNCIRANVKAYAATRYRPPIPLVYVGTETTEKGSIRYAEITEQSTEYPFAGPVASEAPAYFYGKTPVYSTPELRAQLSVQPSGPAGIDVLEIVDDSGVMLMPPGILLAGADPKSKAILGAFGQALLKHNQIAVVRADYTSDPPRCEPTVNGLAGLPGKSELYMARLPTLGEYHPAFDLKPLNEPSVMTTSIMRSDIANMTNPSSQIDYAEPSTEAHLDVAVDYLVN